MEMFDTLRTSSTTRFQNYGKGFVISFTRYKNDPILKLIDRYKDDINVITDIASTFEWYWHYHFNADPTAHG